MGRGRHLVTGACLLAASTAAAAPGDTCAVAIDVPALPFLASATTCGAGNDFTNDGGAAAICADLPRPYGGEDVFYKVILQAGNRLAFDLTYPPGATGDLALFLVRQPSCADPPVCAGTSVDLIGAGVGPERIKLQSYPSGTYYLVVDSALGAPDPAQCGAYTLAVTGNLSEFCGNGIVETGELCDDGNNQNGDCCAADCKSKTAAGTSCRAAAGACDLAEVCDGNGSCPADQFSSAGTVCRAAAGNCDLPEICSGTSAACPADKVVVIGPLCRSPAGPCDAPEFCDGVNGVCPADVMQPAGTVCALATTCTQAARCAGSTTCPVALPTNCDDGDSCTMDSCDLVSSCLHRPICRDAGADASVDARPDGPVDSSSPDVAADAPPAPADAGTPGPADAPVVGADAAPGTDAAPAPRDVAADNAFREEDARTSDEPLGTQSLIDGASTLAPVEAGNAAAGPEAGVGATADALAAGDAGSVTADAGAGTDARKLTNDLTGGCSCRLNASSSPQVSGLWAVLGLALFTRLARRRRRGP